MHKTCVIKLNLNCVAARNIYVKRCLNIVIINLH